MATCEVKAKKIVEVDGVVLNLSLLEARQLVELLDCVLTESTGAGLGTQLTLLSSTPVFPLGRIDINVADLIRSSLEAAGVEDDE